MLRIAVCEDEDIHAEILERVLKSWGESREVSIKIKRFSSGESFLFQWEDESFDLIILDIQMEEMTGMETAEKIRESDEEVEIIFLTSRTEYILKGYDVRALSYLLKPTKEAEVFGVMDRFYKNFESSNRKEKYLSVVTGKELKKIKISDILYCVVYSHYTEIVTKKETVTYKKKLSELEEELPKDSFIKSHRSYLVNINKIEQVLKDEIIMENNHNIPIARGKREYVLESYMKIF